MNLSKIGYFISVVVFAFITFLTLSDANNGLFVGLTFIAVALISALLVNVKWDEDNKKALDDATESSKVFIKGLPFNFIGNLGVVWALLLLLSSLSGIIVGAVPSIPLFIFPILGSLGLILGTLSILLSIGSGKLSQASLTSMLLGIVQLIIAVTSAMGTKLMPTTNMALFLIFWSIFNVFSIYSKKEAPKEKAPKEKKEKPKKEKKKKTKSKETEKVEETPSEEVSEEIVE